MNYEQKYKEALKIIESLYNVVRYQSSSDALLVSQTIEKAFPELIESEDERIRKEIIDFIQEREIVCSNGDSFLPYKKWIAWLEKQGEKSDYNPYKETVKSISIMVEKYAKSGSDLQDFYNNIKVKCKDAMEYDKTWTEKQGEQKPIDKVESKFKVGDWVVYEGLGTYKVVEIHEGWYSVIDSNDRRWSVMFEKESLCHLWTIQDAKDGDVLSSGNPFIFRGFGDKRHPNSPTAYCGINSSGTFNLSSENDWWTANDVHPATKEQCDLLFSKMKEAGYEWDAEKKELRKIEPKFMPGECIRYRGENYKIKDIEKTKNGFIYNVSIIGKPSDSEEIKTAIGMAAEKDMVKIEQPSTNWSEEDEDIVDIAIKIIQNGGDDCAGILDSNKALRWLKSLKDRLQPQPKQEWSEEDNTRFNHLIGFIQKYGYQYFASGDKVIDWLKSLKPQSHWKPTEEQMQALKHIIDFHSIQKITGILTREQLATIKSLYDDLKKL